MRKVAFTLAVVLAGTASFTQATRAEQDKASEVLAAVQKAIGGGKLDSMKTFSLNAKTARNMGERQQVADVELYFEMPDKFLRVENVTAPVPRTTQTGFNGEQAILPQMNMGMAGGAGHVIMSTGGGHVAAGGGGAAVTQVFTMRAGAEMAAASGASGGGTNMTPEQQKAMLNTTMLRSQRVEASRYMLGWFGAAHPGLKATYSYAGEAESADGKAHVINVKADGGFEAKLFIDQATNLPLMLSWIQQERPPFQMPTGANAPVVSGGTPPPPPPPPGGRSGGAGTTTTTTTQMTPEMQKAFDDYRKTPPSPVEYRIYYAEWKEVDGIKFPHVLQRARAGATTEEWTIEKIKVNPKIDAKKFKVD